MQQKLFHFFLLQEAGTSENKIKKNPRKPSPKLKKNMRITYFQRMFALPVV